MPPSGSFVTLRSIANGDASLEFIAFPLDEILEDISTICLEPVDENAPQVGLLYPRQGVVLNQRS